MFMMELPKRHATSLYGQPARAHYVGNFGDRARHTDGQVFKLGESLSPRAFTQKRVASAMT